MVEWESSIASRKVSTWCAELERGERPQALITVSKKPGGGSGAHGELWVGFVEGVKFVAEGFGFGGGSGEGG